MILMAITGALLYVLFVLLLSARPARPTLSVYELRRREKLHDSKAAQALRREALLARLAVLKLPFGVLLGIGMTFLFVHACGRTEGLLVTLLLMLVSARLAAMGWVRHLANRILARYEPALLRLAAKREAVLKVLTGTVPPARATPRVGSREELVHQIETATIFSDDDKQLVENALGFKERTAAEVMTPKKDVTAIAYDELLGPLVLDDLHKTGHTLFPVMKGEQVVGILDSTEHSALHIKDSMPVRSVMNTDFVKIEQDASLETALDTLVEARQQLLVVTDSEDQMAGLLTLAAIVQALTGTSRR